MPTTRRHVTSLAVALGAAFALISFALAGHAFAGSVGRPPLWLKQWSPGGSDSVSTAPRLTRSADGDVYEAALVYRSSTGYYDWAVARYAPAGKRRWVRRLSGAFPFGSLFGVAADDAGNVVLVGQIEGPIASADDWLVAMYARGGQLRWKKRLAGSAVGLDRALDVAAGPNGSFYVAGHLYRTGHYDDGALVRFSAGGKRLWSRYVDGSSHGSDKLTAVAVDSAGRAYVTGSDYDGGRADDVIVARYSANGHRDWLRRWGDPVAKHHDDGTDIAVRGSTVAVTGISQAADLGWTPRGVALDYSTAGKFRWRRIRPNDSAALDATFDLVGVDGQGRVAVAGLAVTWAGVPAPLRWVTTVYSATGAEGVVQQLWGDVEPYNAATGLASSSAGRVYETGSLNYAASAGDIHVVSLRPDGTVAWSSRVYGAGTSDDQGGGIVVTSNAVYVAARYGNAMALLKYEP